MVNELQKIMSMVLFKVLPARLTSSSALFAKTSITVSLTSVAAHLWLSASYSVSQYELPAHAYNILC